MPIGAEAVEAVAYSLDCIVRLDDVLAEVDERGLRDREDAVFCVAAGRHEGLDAVADGIGPGLAASFVVGVHAGGETVHAVELPDGAVAGDEGDVVLSVLFERVLAGVCSVGVLRVAASFALGGGLEREAGFELRFFELADFAGEILVVLINIHFFGEGIVDILDELPACEGLAAVEGGEVVGVVFELAHVLADINVLVVRVEEGMDHSEGCAAVLGWHLIGEPDVRRARLLLVGDVEVAVAVAEDETENRVRHSGEDIGVEHEDLTDRDILDANLAEDDGEEGWLVLDLAVALPLLLVEDNASFIDWGGGFSGFGAALPLRTRPGRCLLELPSLLANGFLLAGWLSKSSLLAFG